MKNKNSILSTFKSDFPASIVVFLVALPLCLGVAVASGADPFTGIIAGVCGGIVVGIISKSQLSVSGPAAGLTSIVATAIITLGSYEAFLVSVIIAGLFQIVMGLLKAGVIGDFIPNSVIKGMLAAIGIILILKQIPHFFGYDADPEGDESFFQVDNSNTFSELINSLNHITLGAVIVGFLGIFILLIYELKSVKKIELLKFIPAPLVIVVVSVLFNEILLGSNSSLAIEKEHLVSLPILNHPFEIMGVLKIPNWSVISDSNVWIIGFTIALVASLESLLSLEAVDDLDPEKRFSFPNKELVAQGAGNLVSGLLGGLPVTSVIVRSSANVNAGGRTKLSAILHGFFLLISILFLSTLLNKIPLAALASILIYTGYKLAKISLFKQYFRKGWDQFIPFLVTILAIVLTDLLKGITIGILVGLFYTFRSNFKSSVFIIKDEYRYLMRFRKDVSFLNKSLIKRTLANIPDDSALILDPTKAEFIDKDVIDVVNDFLINAESRNIRVYIKKKPGKEDIFERQNQLDFKN